MLSLYWEFKRSSTAILRGAGTSSFSKQRENQKETINDWKHETSSFLMCIALTSHLHSIFQAHTRILLCINHTIHAGQRTMLISYSIYILGGGGDRGGRLASLRIWSARRMRDFRRSSARFDVLSTLPKNPKNAARRQRKYISVHRGSNNKVKVLPRQFVFYHCNNHLRNVTRAHTLANSQCWTDSGRANREFQEEWREWERNKRTKR